MEQCVRFWWLFHMISMAERFSCLTYTITSKTISKEPEKISKEVRTIGKRCVDSPSAKDVSIDWQKTKEGGA